MEQSINNATRYPEAESELRYYAHKKFPRAILTMLDENTIRASSPDDAQLSYFGDKSLAFEMKYVQACGGIIVDGNYDTPEMGRIAELNELLDHIDSHLDRLYNAAPGSGYDEMPLAVRQEEISSLESRHQKVTGEIQAIKASYAPVRCSLNERLTAARQRCNEQQAATPEKPKTPQHESAR